MERWMDLLLKHCLKKLIKRKPYGGPMREIDIDRSERWLAFRCLHCHSQLAKDVIVEAPTGVLLCPGCRGYVRQLAQHEIFGESWGAYVRNPYYLSWYRRWPKQFVEFLRRLF